MPKFTRDSDASKAALKARLYKVMIARRAARMYEEYTNGDGIGGVFISRQIGGARGYDSPRALNQFVAELTTYINLLKENGAITAEKRQALSAGLTESTYDIKAAGGIEGYRLKVIGRMQEVEKAYDASVAAAAEEHIENDGQPTTAFYQS